MIAPFDSDTFHIFDPIKTDSDLDAPQLQTAIDRLQPIFGVVHCDPGAPDSLATLSELARMGSTYLVGAIASGEKGAPQIADRVVDGGLSGVLLDRKSTRLNSGHITISYDVFCLKKKNTSRVVY